MKSRLLASLLTVLTTSSLFAVPVNINPASANISADLATDASSPGWTTLPNLVVAEKLNNPGKQSISGSGTLILSAPAGFEFNTNAVLSTTFSGGDLTAVSAAVTSPTTITVNVAVSGTANHDSFTISGIQAHSLSGTTLETGNITRTGGTAVIDGATSFGTLTEVAGVATSLQIATQPSTNAIAGEALLQQPVIQLRDQFGNVSSQDNSSIVGVTGTSALLGSTSVTAVAGVATYTNLALADIGSHTLQFSSGALAPVVSEAIEVIAGAPKAAALVISVQPSATATAGVEFAQQPVIAVYDQYGAPFTNDSVSVVTAARLDGNGDLQGTLTANVVEGIATFTNLSHNVAGDITLNFTSGTFSNAVSSTVSVAPAAVTSLAFTTQPGNALVGLPFGTQPVLTAVDAFNNPSTVGLSNVVEVTLALITDGSGSLSGTTVTNIGTEGANGVVSFSDLQISAPALNNQLTATAAGLNGATSDVFAVSSVVPTQIVIQTQPSTNAVAGEVFAQQPVLRLVDANGNLAVEDNSTVVTVTASSGGLQGTLQAVASGGVVTFTNLSRSLVGTFTLNFSAPGLTGATSEAITVSPAAASTLAFVTSPGVARVGSPFGVQPVIETRDAFGNDSTVGLASNQLVTVSLTSGTGELLGTTTADIGTAAGNGTVQFADLQIDVAGTGKQLTATNDLLASATSAAFVVGGVVPADTTVSVDTSVSGSVLLDGPVYYEAASGDVGVGTITLNAPAGFEFVTGGQTPRVQIHRIAGPNGGGINGINSGTPQDVTSFSSTQITYEITQPSSGGTVNSITWSQIRVRALSGTPTSGDITKSGTSVMATVVDGVTSFGHLQTEAGQFAQLAILTQPSAEANAGLNFPQQPVLQLQDQFGNPLTNDNTTVVTATANGSSALQGNTVVTATNGLVTFTDLAYNVSETITITFSSGAVNVTSSDIVVGAGPVTGLVFTTEPGTAVAGMPFTVFPAVATVDQFGNPSTVNLASNLLVELSLTSGSGLTGTTTLDIGTAAGNGVVTFSNLLIQTAGASNQLTASAAGLPNAVSGYFTVIAADHLEYIQGDGQTAAAGTAVAINPTVRVVDAQSNAVAGATVTFTVQSGGGSVSQSSVITDVDGLASTIFTLGGVLGDSNQVLTASANLPGVPTSITFYATATVGQPSRLSIATQPSATATAGEVFAQQPSVRIEDAFGNLIADDNTTVVTVGLNTGTGTLNGVLTATATNGVATFTNLSYNVAETIELVFTAAGLTNVVSSPIVVSPAVASILGFTTQPGDAYTDEILNPQPVVKSQDIYGNDSTNGLAASVIVSLTLTSGTGELLGTTNIDIGTAGSSVGVATFTNLQVTTGGIDKQLTASAEGLTNAVSDTFRIGGVDPATSPIAPASGSSVPLTGPTYYELNSGDASVGTIVLNAPAGFEFDTNFTPVVRVQRIGGNGAPANNINGASNGANGTEYPVTITPTQITFEVTSASTNGVTSSITWENIYVRLGVGGVTTPSQITKTGTSTMAAVVDGVTNFGTLNGEARPSQIVILVQPSTNATVGVNFAQQPVVRVEDQFGNLWTNSSVTVTAVRNAGTGDLQGTVSVQTVNGIATFTDLHHDVASTITINFTGATLATVTSTEIVVSPVGGKLNQTITFDELSPKSVTDGPFTVSATASSGLPVTFSIVSGPATIVSNIITLDGTVGTVVVRASQAGDATYNPAPDVDRSFQVVAQNQMTQVITFDLIPNKTFGDAPFTINATASSGLPVTFTVISGEATVSNNVVTLTGIGPVVIRASQAGNASYSAAPNVDRTFQVNPASTDSVKSDLNGDGKTDIWFQNGNRVIVWLMNGLQFDRGVLVSPSFSSTNWFVAGQDDFNADGRQDILWQHRDGRLVVWYMNGNVRSGSAAIRSIHPIWKAVAVADMNGDSSPDIVFQAVDGRVAVRYLNGVNIIGVSVFNQPESSTGWRVAGAGDIDKDSVADLLVQHTDGRVAMWKGQGNTSGTFGTEVPLNSGRAIVWDVVGLGDLNQDQNLDILLFSPEGRLAAWTMNGVQKTGRVDIRSDRRVVSAKVVGPR